MNQAHQSALQPKPSSSSSSCAVFVGLVVVLGLVVEGSTVELRSGVSSAVGATVLGAGLEAEGFTVELGSCVVSLGTPLLGLKVELGLRVEGSTVELGPYIFSVGTPVLGLRVELGLEVELSPSMVSVGAPVLGWGVELGFEVEGFTVELGEVGAAAPTRSSLYEDFEVAHRFLICLWGPLRKEPSARAIGGGGLGGFRFSRLSSLSISFCGLSCPLET